ncbi:arginase family protein [Herbiconiux moechotypicola]|uniref:Arginase family protein n=1 Tax=Herbiconiux moechotypicola TaxID=637393 RepID=A0ABN3D7J8_9MICO|nr:arginase family protein [Herbiconiux moechotypicola]MCS5728412.1 arginase family protein [Herbiconiux moechotypicola]
MAATFVVVPQWQGSGSTRAMRLIDGAEAVRGDLPASATRVVEVPAGAGEALDTGVHRYSSITAVAEALDAELASIDGVPVVIGGDCGVEFAAVRHAVRRTPGPVALVWFDAHPDLNTPESSPSGAFHGMVARALLGDGPAGLVEAPALSAGSLVLAGTRALDDAEAEFISENGVALVPPGDLTPEALAEAVRATGARSVYLHVDLDVLDPAEIEGVAFPEPFGVGVATLVESIRALRAEFDLVGAGITEFAPSAPDAAVADLPAILRIISALVR